MRNPIQPSPARPIPLPDCILMDAWWTECSDDWHERPVDLHPVTGKRETGQADRNRGAERPRR